MIKKIVWAAVGVLVGVGLLAGVFFAREARPLILSIVAVGLGTFIGVGWGSKKATETEEYRQEWFAKRKPVAADTDETPDTEQDGR